MNRPYIICHMATSLDGKVTGKFLNAPECEPATGLYYQINREYQADGFACGRVTMEGSFTGGWYPDLSEFAPCYSPMDYLVDDLPKFYAVAFDPHGRLGWQSSIITDEEASEKIEVAVIEGKGTGKMVEINLDTICENFEDGETVTLAALKAKRLVNAKAGRLKILARGRMTKTLTVCADKFSLQAVKMITLAEGTAKQYK